MRKFPFMTTAAACALGLSLAGPASAQGPQGARGATVLRADLQPVRQR
jgi:hypothetical protein